jgi:thiamine kinase-like enzyme
MCASSALSTLLAGSGEPGLAALRSAVERALGPVTAVTAERKLKQRVHRVAVVTGDGERSIVVKRFDAPVAYGTRLLAERWLPAVGLGDCGPPLLATGADPEGRWVWQVQEDLGEQTVCDRQHDARAVSAVAELAATLHARFVRHPMLPECRLWLGERGATYLESSARDASVAVAELLSAGAVPTDREELAERLAARLHALDREVPDRANALTRWGGPETLVHGDLWTTNAFVAADGRARLIDWDRAGVGPGAYDVSALLYRFAAGERPAVLAAYRAALDRLGVELPGDDAFAAACESAEYARICVRVVWPAAALRTGADDWAWTELETVDSWFGELEPVLAR